LNDIDYIGSEISNLSFFNIILIIFLKKDKIEDIANWMKKIYKLLKTSY